eukprot:15281330-Alexandrium_andersonii.AAC.1
MQLLCFTGCATHQSKGSPRKNEFVTCPHAARHANFMHGACAQVVWIAPQAKYLYVAPSVFCDHPCAQGQTLHVNRLALGSC